MKTLLRLSILALTVHAGVAVAQDQPAGEQALPAKALIAFRRAPLAEISRHPKDAGLVNALGMLEARVGELPEESMGEFPEEGAAAAQQVLGLLGAPCRFAIIQNPSSMSGGAFGYGVIAGSLLGAAEKADRLQGLVEEAIQRSGEDLPKRSRVHPGMREVRTPAGKLVFGPRRFESGSGYEAYFGTVDDPDAPFAAIPEPSIPGLRPFVTGIFDFSALTPAANAAQMAMGQAAGPDGAQIPNVFKELSGAGLIGENAMKGSFEWGQTGDASRFRVRVENAAGALAAAGLGEGRLKAEQFATIPADAVSAAVGLVNTDSIQRSIARMRQQGVPVDEALGQFKEHTGVDVEKDLLAAVGGASVMYSSDTTGGGGLMSYVALLGLKDRGAFEGAHRKLLAFADRMLAGHREEPDGQWARYVRFRSWSAQGQPAFSLTFPGVPVPLQISWALTDQWLVVGLTPQAVIAAVGQALGKGDAGILSRKDLMYTEFDKRRTLSWSFGDTRRTLREGYGMLTLVGAAISNGVSSPADSGRDPGMVIPAYAELAAGVRPAVSAAYVENDVLILDRVCDPSLVVTLGSAAGGYSQFLPLLAGVAAAGAAGERSEMQQMLDLSSAWPKPGDGSMIAGPVFALWDSVEGPLSWISPRKLVDAQRLVLRAGDGLLKP